MGQTKMESTVNEAQHVAHLTTLFRPRRSSRWTPQPRLVASNSAHTLLRSRFQAFTTPSWDLPNETRKTGKTSVNAQLKAIQRQKCYRIKSSNICLFACRLSSPSDDTAVPRGARLEKRTGCTNSSYEYARFLRYLCDDGMYKIHNSQSLGSED